MRTLRLILGVLMAGSFAHAATVTVHPGAPLASALKAAGEGDTVRLLSGVHHGPVVLTKRVVLMGDPGAHLVGSGEGTVLTIRADGCAVTGLTISGSGRKLLDDDAGVKVFADDVRIVGNRLERNLHGVYVQGGDRAFIADNVILGRADLISSDRGNGVHLWSATGCEVRGNEIAETRDGIYMSFAHRNVVRNNHVRGVRYGLHYMYSNENRFDHNTFERNVAGAALMYSRGIVVERNRFRHNRSYWAHGILFQSCDGTVVRENLIVDNTNGLFLGDANENRFVRNAISGNDVAVYLHASSVGNIFTRNLFGGNLTALALEGRLAGEANRWAEDGLGNYWSNYRGYDLDGDGIGDVPHMMTNVFEYLEGSIPLIRLYLRSPAADALVLAERALPVIDVPTVYDPAPLMRPPEGIWARSERRSGAGGWLASTLSVLVAVGCLTTRMVMHR